MKPQKRLLLLILAVLFLHVSPAVFCFIAPEQAPQKHALHVEKSVLEKSAYRAKKVVNVGEGAVSDTDCIDLDAEGSTIDEANISYEFLPANYPYMNLYLDIYENDSRLYFSGATEGGSITIPKGMPFDSASEYKAQLVVNKYYCDFSIPFDVEDSDPTVNEVQKVEFQRIKFIDIEDKKRNVPIMPGKDATALAITEPEGVTVTWTIEKEEPMKESEPIEANIDESTGVITVEENSGSGWITIRATDPERFCFKEALVFVGCPGCDEDATYCVDLAGGALINLASIDIHFTVGKEKDGVQAGEIVIKAKEPSPDLATPKALDFKSLVRDVNATSGDNGLNQVQTRKTNVRVFIIDEYSYEIRFYKHDSAIEDPIVVWKIENPDRSPDTYNRLVLTETRGDKVKAYEYIFDETGNTWTLIKGNGLKVETKSEEQVGDDLIITHTVKDSAENIASKVRTTKREFPFGEKLIETVVDPDGDALTTTYSYYDDPAGQKRYGKLKEQVDPTGATTSYEYDLFGRKTKKTEPWLDGSGRVTLYDYTPQDPNDSNWPTHFRKPRIITEQIQGITTAKTFYSYNLNLTTFEITEIEERCVDPGAEFGAATNLSTTKVYHRKGTEDSWAGELKELHHPDGRLDTYLYESGTFSTNGSAGEIAFTPGSGNDVKLTVIHGTESSPTGIAYKTTEEVSYTDEFGQELFQETYVHTGSGSERINWTAFEYDDLGRLTKTTNSDGTYSEATWDCCGKTSETNYQGIETTYTYDDLHRVETETKVGIAAGQWPVQNDITTTYTFDAEGRVLTTTVEGDSLSQLETKEYDVSGRINMFVDQAGMITEFDYDQTGLITTITRPGGFTEKTTSHQDGRIKSITETAVVNRFYEYGINADGTQWATEYLADENSPRWEKTTTDLMSRSEKVEKPGYSQIESVAFVYNNKGQLIKTETTGLADTIYEYDEVGNQFRAGLDVDHSSQLELNSNDSINETDISFFHDGQVLWSRTISRVYANDNDSTPTTTSIIKDRLNGFGGSGMVSETIQFDIDGNQIINRTFIDASSKSVKQLIDYPDLSINQVTINVNGLLVSAKSKSGIETKFLYNSLGWQTGIIDPRLGQSTIHYNDYGQVDYVEDPAGNKTWNTYDPVSGILLARKNDYLKATRYKYNDRGQVTHTWGDVPYPVMQIYDDYGQLTEMHTYRDGSNWNSETWPDGSTGDADVTIWHYHENSGLVTAKEDDAGKQVSYTYTYAGNLATRTWARAGGTIVTTYSYDSDTGELLTIDYSDATPDITFTYDRLGRQKTVTDAVGTRIFAYNNSLQPQSETITGLYDKVITRTYSNSGVKGRSTGFTLGSDYSVSYGYDGYGRFNAVNWEIAGQSHSASYSYMQQSDLLEQLNMSGTGTTLNTSYVYEPNRNLRNQVKNAVGTETISQYDYTFDNIGLRTSVMNGGSAFAAVNSAFNLYNYDDRNEVSESSRYIGTDINDTSNPVPEEYRLYDYDPIGNRKDITEGFDSGSYTTNNLNQYLDSTLGTQTQSFIYDDDGNLTDIIGSSHVVYTYNAENRLIAFEPQSPALDDKKVEFVYDYLGRRVKKTIFTWDGSWSVDQEMLFVYDGWNLIAEISNTGNKFFVWGLDLSNSLQGAGGIGGLLSCYDSNTISSYFYLFDSNGNVGQLIDSSNGNIAAHYEYDAYGNILIEEGIFVSLNSIRFSTKYFDVETDLYYYGYRYLLTVLGRWTRLDPTNEFGGINLYNFVRNNVTNLFDILGLAYGKHLTKDEAKQLNCAIRFWLDDARVYNALFLTGSEDRSLTLKFLRRYMNKTGGILRLPYDAIKNDAVFRGDEYLDKTSKIDTPNERAVSNLVSKNTYKDKIYPFGSIDLATSIGGATLYYKKNKDGTISGAIRDTYTFLDETDEIVGEEFKYLHLEGMLCCWKGPNYIKDIWMGDLERYGFAKTFKVHIDWVLNP